MNDRDENLAQHGSDIDNYSDVDIMSNGERAVGGVPVVGKGYSIYQTLMDCINGDGRMADAGSIAADITAMAAEAGLALRDPIFALANAGLSVLLELIEPLNNLLHLASGNPAAMEEQMLVWEQISAAMEGLSAETEQVIDSDIPTWQGDDADAAREQLYGLAAADLAIAHEASNIQQLLSWAKALAETIYALLKSILAELVAWLITRGLIALANSSWTFGAAFASFVLQGVVKSTQMIMRALDKFKQAAGIFGKIGKIAHKLLGTNSFRGLTEYKLIKGLAIKAGIGTGVAAGTGLLSQIGNSGPTANPSVPAGSNGEIVVELGEFEALAGDLDSLGSNVGSIKNTASQAAAAEFTWGATGLFFEGPYSENCAGLIEMLNDIEGTYNGDSTKLRTTAEEHQSSDDESAADLESILAKYAD